MEATSSIGRSSAKVLIIMMEHSVLVPPVVGCFKLAPRSGILTVLDLHRMDVPLIVMSRKGYQDLNP